MALTLVMPSFGDPPPGPANPSFALKSTIQYIQKARGPGRRVTITRQAYDGGPMKKFRALRYYERWFWMSSNVEAYYVDPGKRDAHVPRIITIFPQNLKRDDAIEVVSKYLGQEPLNRGVTGRTKPSSYYAIWKTGGIVYTLDDYGDHMEVTMVLEKD